MTDDLLERRLRSELRDLAEAVPEVAAVLEHPEGASSVRRPRRRSHPRLAVAACMLLALGLTLALLSWGRMGKGVAQPASKATVEQAMDDMLAVEEGQRALAPLVRAAEGRCMAAHGFPGEPTQPSSTIPPMSLLSGQRTEGEARQDGYGLRAAYDASLGREPRDATENEEYLKALRPRPPAWVKRIPGGERLGRRMDHLLGREGCEAVALREVWGDRADEEMDLEESVGGPLVDATAWAMTRSDAASNASSVSGEDAWRRCMVTDRLLFPHGDPAPLMSLGDWMMQDLTTAFGLAHPGYLRPLEPGALERATAHETALALRDVQCSATPSVQTAILEKRRFQTEFALQGRAGLAEPLHGWRVLVDEVRQAHGL